MESIQQLQERIKQLENQQGMLVKKGTIVFIHPVEHPTEKFSKIEIGIDCTEVLSGRTFTSFLGCQVSNYNKDLFKKFDRSEGNETNLAYKVGDEVKVMCNVEARSINKDKKNGDRDIIFNNCSLEKVMLIASSGTPALPVEEDKPAVEEGDVPF